MSNFKPYFNEYPAFINSNLVPVVNDVLIKKRGKTQVSSITLQGFLEKNNIIVHNEPPDEFPILDKSMEGSLWAARDDDTGLIVIWIRIGTKWKYLDTYGPKFHSPETNTHLGEDVFFVPGWKDSSFIQENANLIYGTMETDGSYVYGPKAPTYVVTTEDKKLSFSNYQFGYTVGGGSTYLYDRNPDLESKENKGHRTNIAFISKTLDFTMNGDDFNKPIQFQLYHLDDVVPSATPNVVKCTFLIGNPNLIPYYSNVYTVETWKRISPYLIPGQPIMKPIRVHDRLIEDFPNKNKDPSKTENYITHFPIFSDPTTFQYNPYPRNSPIKEYFNKDGAEYGYLLSTQIYALQVLYIKDDAIVHMIISFISTERSFNKDDHLSEHKIYIGDKTKPLVAHKLNKTDILPDAYKDGTYESRTVTGSKFKDFVKYDTQEMDGYGRFKNFGVSLASNGVRFPVKIKAISSTDISIYDKDSRPVDIYDYIKFIDTLEVQPRLY